jgi:hypothetical protein
VLLATLLALSFYDIRLKKIKRRLEILIQINQNEINAIAGDFSVFNDGHEFLTDSHPYTHDLDIFGKGSLYQFVNRASTFPGRKKLADFLASAFSYADKIKQRQDAVAEIASMPALRHEMQYLFYDQPLSETDQQEINAWLEGDNLKINKKILRWLAYGLPALTVIGIVLSIVGIISFPSYLIVIQLIVVFWYGRKTLSVQQSITSKSKILNRYAEAFALIEKADFKTAVLQDVKSQLSVSQQQTASGEISLLSVLLKYMDSNLNLLVSVILNGLFMFNLHILLRADAWQQRNRHQAHAWFDALATLDALSGIGNMLFNNPDFVFPKVAPGSDFKLHAVNTGHPLIDSATRVTNNVQVQGWNNFSIITGANMSGKSTFLRTIGVNFVLAMCGAPVCATEFVFYPVQIHSSIRTSDSLTRKESYFYAELKRLREIIVELEQGNERLILLDEILKGTNSKDKQSGSMALIRQLLKYRSAGFFATHDLALGDLATVYPDHVQNLCFEISIEDDKMLIDYKLHHGVCKNLNATYLMKNMGILLDE